MLKGCDISRYQQNKVDLSKFDFVIIKASEGCDIKDKYLDVHYNTLSGRTDGKPAKDKLYGFYHYARPEYNNAKDEARWFVSLVGHHMGHCVYALDWEAEALKYPITWAKEWLDEVYRLTGVRPLIYCSASYAKNLQLILDGNYGLWVAHWDVSVDDVITGVYPTWAFWQYQGSPLDLNLFNGTEEQFRKYCWSSIKPTEEQTTREKFEERVNLYFERMCTDLNDTYGYGKEQILKYLLGE